MRKTIGLALLIILGASCSDDTTLVKKDKKVVVPPRDQSVVDQPQSQPDQNAAVDLRLADKAIAADQAKKDAVVKKDTTVKKDAAKNDLSTVDKKIVDKAPPTEAKALEAAAPVSHLVINEVDYNQAGTDAAEYLEIYNPTSSAVPLANLAVLFVNGGLTPPTVYLTVDISSAGSLGAGQYLVLKAAAVTVPAGALKIDFTGTTNIIQNGNPDGVALVNTSTTTVIDALSYGGAITNAPLFAGSTTSVVEGTVLDPTVIDTETTTVVPTGALCRLPNGKDTDNANADWKLCSAPTPGAANVP